VGRKDEALAQFRRAVEIDPLSIIFNVNLAIGYSNAHQYGLAMEQYRKTQDIDSAANVHGNMSITAFEMGDYELWLEEWRKSAEVNDDKEDLAMANETAKIYAKSGLRPAVLRRIELQQQLAKRRYVDPTAIAFDYAALDMKDQAFLWLEKGYAEKSEGMQYVKIVKALDAYRADPHYIDLLKRMGLTP
jgi:tetratricopeptide (TPR) repeat protein